ncbi:Winged helix DNA-binding domain protein [uncultured archaeon]|nr:Winged helix DNA-binding domain protein [uncultured archaeon]
MNSDFLSLIEESKALNSSVFSLIRLQLLASIASVGQDGVMYRELKAALNVTDGALYTNLEALKENGYIKSNTIELEGKKLEAYQITYEGALAWGHTKNWLRKLVDCGVKK